MTAFYLACGIDPKNFKIFAQSQVPMHTEMNSLLSHITPLSWLNRMIQYKQKKVRGASIGLFTYPLLQAADVILYNTKIVPVGQDQKQHLELTKLIAQRLNDDYNCGVNIPQIKIAKQGKIMNLKNPLKKMSKSDPDKQGVIFMTDSLETAGSKIMNHCANDQQTIQNKNGPNEQNLIDLYLTITSQKQTDF